MKPYRFLSIGLLLLLILPVKAQQAVGANKALLGRYVDEVLNGGDTELIPELFADDFVMRDSMSGAIGVSMFAGAVYYGDQEGYRDEALNPVYLGQGDTVAVLFMSPALDGQSSTAVPEVDIARLRNGKIVEMWGVWDQWRWNLQFAGEEVVAAPENWFTVPSESTTTPEENLTLVERAWTLWASGDIADMAEVYTDDLSFHLPLSISTEPLDRDSLADYIVYLHEHMPDFTLVTEEMPCVAEGSLVVCYYVWNGRFTPEQSDKAIAVKAEGADVYRIVDGKIAEVWWNWYARSFQLKVEWFAPPAAD